MARGLEALRKGLGGDRSPSRPCRRGSRPLPVGNPPGGLGGLESPFLKAMRGWETHPEGWVGCVGPPIEPGGVERLF